MAYRRAASARLDEAVDDCLDGSVWARHLAAATDGLTAATGQAPVYALAGRGHHRR